MADDQGSNPGASTATDAEAWTARNLTDRIAALEAENAELKERMSAMLGSTSWRVMRPVRHVVERLRRPRQTAAGRGGPAGRAIPSHPGTGRVGTVSPKAHWVLDTGLFDASAYRKAAGLDGDLSDVEAAEHYALSGEGQGLMPNPHFDPLVYADLHREVAKSGMGLLLHYASHGWAEGRPAVFSPADHVRQGKRPFDPGRKTVLLVCHEASRTGAPILGWNLARQLNRDHNLVIAMIYPDGDLIDLFVEESSFLIGPFKKGHLPWFYMARVGRYLADRFAFDFAIVNSIESHPMLIGMAAANVPTVTLIHEFATSVEPPSRMTSGLLLSTQVVFDARSQHQSALDVWPGVTTRNHHVFHQGASEVPLDPKKAAGGKPAAPSVHDAVRGDGRRPVVLGLGTVSMRKGVDLFVACAKAVSRTLGRGRARFVWIGHLPNPHPESLFIDFLNDQVKRSDLGDDLVFLDAVDDLAGAYAAADIAMISSRLDPFPNVAMDAALAGVPVICFAEGNGFADYLTADPRTAFLAASYLNVHDAALTIVDLIGDETRRRQVGDVLRERARGDFPMDRYMVRLAPLIADAKAIAAQERRDIDLLLADDTFSPELWLNPTDLFTREEAVRLHVRKAASGQEANQYCRRPALGFVPQVYADHHPDLDAVPYPNPLAHWIRTGKPAGPWAHPVLVAPDATPTGQGGALKAALHIHLFYPELAEGLLAALAASEARLDLFVSTASDEKAEDLRGRFAGWDRGDVVIAVCPNRGRDVGPMLTEFAGALQRYDVFGHVHGKRSLALSTIGLTAETGVQWHGFLMEHLVGARFPIVDLILDRFAASDRLGLVFPEDPNLTGWSLDREIARTLARRMDPAMEIPHSIDFPIGTMFWARPAALKPLFDLHLGWDDYPAEPVPIDGTMLHALERLLPVIATHAGYDLMTTHVPGVTR